MRLTVNLCTRNRPALMLETVALTLPNIAREDTTYLVSIDADDQATVAALDRLPTDPRIKPLVLEREDSFGGKMNRALVHAPADLYLFQADYTPHLTPGFDDRLLDAAALFPDGIGVVDGAVHSLWFCCAQAVTAKLAEKLGYIYPPWFPFWFVDHWLEDIARCLGRLAYVDIAMSDAKKPGTQARRDTHFWSVLYDVLEGRRLTQARAILHSPEFIEAPWRKKLLEDAFPLVAARSRIVSRDTRRLGTILPDREAANDEEEERYRRIKARGRVLMAEAMSEMVAEIEKPNAGN